MKTISKALAAILALSSLAAVAVPAQATVFVAWDVANVDWDDTLNVRKYPASYSQKQAAYPNGTTLAMTGRCTDGVNLFDVANLADWKQAQIVRYRWCEVWHDPANNGNYTTGWVYGRYIKPM